MRKLKLQMHMSADGFVAILNGDVGVQARFSFKGPDFGVIYGVLAPTVAGHSQ